MIHFCSSLRMNPFCWQCSGVDLKEYNEIFDFFLSLRFSRIWWVAWLEPHSPPFLSSSCCNGRDGFEVMVRKLFLYKLRVSVDASWIDCPVFLKLTAEPHRSLVPLLRINPAMNWWAQSGQSEQKNHWTALSSSRSRREGAASAFFCPVCCQIIRDVSY